MREKLRVALVHDFLLEYGGAERVLEALHELWPDAPVYVAFLDPTSLDPYWERLRRWDIRTSWGQRVPGLWRFHSPLRFLAPSFFSHFDLSNYEVVISSTNAYFAKSVRVPNGVHICYCHTPSRSLYGYPTRVDWKKRVLTRIYGSLVNHFLRMADWRAAQEVDYFVANSKEVARRIEKFYRRESTVIYPPAVIPSALVSDLPFGLTPGDYYLYVGKLAAAKHVDLVIAACQKLQEKLVVVGDGKGQGKLAELASDTILFTGNVSDETLAALYAGCWAVVYPSEDEDFGIVPVEAMAFGKPVIAHRSGGVVESIVDGKTGILFDDLSVDGVVEAMKKFKVQSSKFKVEEMLTQAKKFRKERFASLFRGFVAECIAKRGSV